MVDVSDEGIRRSLGKVRPDRDRTDWLSATSAEGSSDQFVLAGCGSGGVAEFAASLTPSFRGYAYVRLKGPGRKPYFVVIQFLGQACTAVQKAKIIVHEDDILAVFAPVSDQHRYRCHEKINSLFASVSLVEGNNQNNHFGNWRMSKPFHPIFPEIG
jgi:hypothetical protein